MKQHFVKVKSIRHITPEAKKKRLKEIETVKKNGTIEYGEKRVKTLFAPESFITMGNEIAAIKEEIVNTSRQAIYNTLLALAGRRETCSKLSEISVPVLIMVGKEDKITPPSAALMMHKKIEDSFLVIIDHAGHISNMENHTEFNFQLKKFILSIKLR